MFIMNESGDCLIECSTGAQIMAEGGDVIFVTPSGARKELCKRDSQEKAKEALSGISAKLQVVRM